jgi:hypothetical protein
MRIGMAVVVSVASCVTVATMAACFDLFHSTGNVLTACEVDALTPGCGADAGAALCAADPREARQTAAHACAWLGACETPLGGNSFGSCMVNALMAYDCDINPNHRLKGRAAGLWGCLARARSCGDVDACTFPRAEGVCQSAVDSTTCSGASPIDPNDDVVVECRSGVVARRENCALWGQTCAPASSGGAECRGTDAGDCLLVSGCYDNESTIRCGTDGGDLVTDCASFGAQRCSGFPAGDAAAWIACVAETDAGDAAACAPDAEAACVGGVAVSCPSGVLETLDCASLLGSANGCTPGPLDPPFDWTGSCVMNPPQCLADSCDASTLTACGRGAAFSVDCSEAGLGACTLTATDDASPVRAACTGRP